MSLIPAFEIGLWNAWIFVLYDVLTIPFFFRIARGRAPDPISQFNAMSKTRKTAFYSSKILMFVAFAYSIFVPLKLGTAWFYAGLPIILAGLVAQTIVLVNWAKTPVDEPITRGLYRYSRNPMYISFFLLLLGIAIATASWVFLVFAVGLTIASFVFAGIEEQACLDKYGDTYRDYMNRTSRWIGIPKS